MKKRWMAVMALVLAGLLLISQGLCVRQYVQMSMSESVEREPGLVENDRDMTEKETRQVSVSSGGDSADAVEDQEEETEQKTAYLTFDDGPSELTEQYLDILKRYDAKATFFLIGEQIKGDLTKVVRREINEGHEIGVHTYTHDSSQIYISADSYYEDVCQVKKLLKKKFQYEPTFWRFPWGSANCYICNFKRDIVDRLEGENMDYVDWNVSAEDSVGSPSVESIVANVRKDCFRVDNPVILMHDSSSNRMTLEALESIMEMLQQEGYSFATLAEREKSCHFGEY